MKSRVDTWIGPLKAPEVEINPINGHVDLVWNLPDQRVCVSLASMRQARLLIAKIIEAAQADAARP